MIEDTATVPTEKPSDDRMAMPAGFWRRSAAFAVDLIVVFAIGRVLGTFWFDELAALGQHGIALGAIALLLYFGLLDSRIGGGATLGKRAMAIRVVDEGGAYIDGGRGVARSAVLLLPPLLLDVSAPAGALTALHTVFSWGAIAWLAVCIYLFVFNGDDRRSLHDLLAATTVVRRPGGGVVFPPPAHTLWRGHVVVAAVICAFVAGAGGLVPGGVVADDELRGVDRVRRALQVELGTVRVGAHLGYSLSWSRLRAPGMDDAVGAKAARYVTLSVGLSSEPESFDGVIDRIARALLREFPQSFEWDSIYITVLYGFDIGIAENWIGRSIELTPPQWRERIGNREFRA